MTEHGQILDWCQEGTNPNIASGKPLNKCHFWPPFCSFFEYFFTDKKHKIVCMKFQLSLNAGYDDFHCNFQSGMLRIVKKLHKNHDFHVKKDDGASSIGVLDSGWSNCNFEILNDIWLFDEFYSKKCFFC